MSLYSQNLYGQPSYGGPNYSSSPPSGYQQYYQHGPPQPPALAYHVDATTFRRDFSRGLEQLTFNSRPIIQHLSMFAQDHARYSDIVAECLEEHIRRAPPWTKLPAFYLLDAISKNVYEPYARRFSGFVVALYLDSYPLVDDNTRGKMEEMLLTWRTGSPMGKELFGVQQQMAIERGVWGAGGDTSNMKFHSGSGLITKSQVLSELQFTLGQKERALQASPYDTLSQNHVAVLHQLRMHVEAGVSQEELRQILTQLRNLVKTSVPPPIPQPPIPQPPIPAPSWQTQPPFPPSVPQGVPQLYPHASTSAMKLEQQAVIDPQPTESASVTNAPDNIANLLSTLLKAGVVSASGTPLGAGSTVTEIPAGEPSKIVDPKHDVFRAYRNSILTEVVSLSNFESAKSSCIVELLYDSQSLQCKQCGLRFHDTTLGKRNHNDHLDMHFRQNRKASEDSGRGHSRSWFIGVDDWIHEGEGKEGGSSHQPGRRTTKAAAVADNAKVEADLRAQYVIVPPGDEAQVVSCPICKETLKSEFLEDDEEWVWKNATRKDDRIYHATCYAEAVASTSSLAARLRIEKAHGSRSATPEVHPMAGIQSGTRMTPPPDLRISPSLPPTPDSKIAGTKRKAENSDSNIPEEASGTPPAKKVALSEPSSTS